MNKDQTVSITIRNWTPEIGEVELRAILSILKEDTPWKERPNRPVVFDDPKIKNSFVITCYDDFSVMVDFDVAGFYRSQVQKFAELLPFMEAEQHE